jgi:hypothetical protein
MHNVVHYLISLLANTMSLDVSSNMSWLLKHIIASNTLYLPPWYHAVVCSNHHQGDHLYMCIMHIMLWLVIDYVISKVRKLQQQTSVRYKLLTSSWSRGTNPMPHSSMQYYISTKKDYSFARCTHTYINNAVETVFLIVQPSNDLKKLLIGPVHRTLDILEVNKR